MLKTTRCVYKRIYLFTTRVVENIESRGSYLCYGER